MRIQRHIRMFFSLLLFCLVISSCEDTTEIGDVDFLEDFESGSKTSYTSTDVNLGSGVWNLDDVLIGSSENDRKRGEKSARFINEGRMTMKFDRTSGAGKVSIRHAKYGSDAESTWELWISTNSGSSWTKIGSSITSSSTSINTADFIVNKSGQVRIQIRKVTGGAARLNIDDIVIENYGSGGGSSTAPTRDYHLTLGNPSNATNSTANADNYLVERPEFVFSYSDTRKTANWVAWHLSSAWKGGAERQDDFREDPLLPSGWYRVKTSDYTGSGFDRGHLCPSDDRDKTAEENSTTFYMTNMIPQAPNNNQITWKNLEDYTRSLLSSNYEMYIYAGGYGKGGEGKNGFTEKIGTSPNQITVPARTWKIIVILPIGTNDQNRVSSSTRIIAVDMPNNQSVNAKNWGDYRVSIDHIENKTGFDFLSYLSDATENTIEQKTDTGATE